MPAPGARRESPSTHIEFQDKLDLIHGRNQTGKFRYFNTIVFHNLLPGIYFSTAKIVLSTHVLWGTHHLERVVKMGSREWDMFISRSAVSKHKQLSGAK